VIKYKNKLNDEINSVKGDSKDVDILKVMLIKQFVFNYIT